MTYQVMDPLVSVIVGTYNRSDLFPRAVKSVLNQTYKNIEILLVDDCSSDNTIEQAKKITDRRVKYIQHQINKGISAVSNTGFAHSSGKYIALLGDDDEWIDREKIEKQLKCFASDSTGKLGIVSTWWEEDTGLKCPKEPVNLKQTMLSGGGVVGGSTALISRDAWLSVGGFDEKQKRGTDSDLFRRIVLSGYQIKIIESITTRNYTSHKGVRMTPLDNVSSLDCHIAMLKYNIDKLQEHYNKYPKALSKYYENIGNSYWKTFLMTDEKQRLYLSRNYFLRAFYLCPAKFKLALKFFSTYFPFFTSKYYNTNNQNDEGE